MKLGNQRLFLAFFFLLLDKLGMKNVFYWKNRQINKALKKEIPLSLNPSFIDDCIMNVHNITFFY